MSEPKATRDLFHLVRYMRDWEAAIKEIDIYVAARLAGAIDRAVAESTKVCCELDDFQRTYERNTSQPGYMPGNQHYSDLLMEIVRHARAVIQSNRPEDPCPEPRQTAGEALTALEAARDALGCANPSSYNQLKDAVVAGLDYVEQAQALLARKGANRES